MFKKIVLLSSLILFSIPNVFYPNGDECANCMNSVALRACLCVALVCIYSAEQDKNTRDSKTCKFVVAPKPQQMGQIENNCKPGP